MQVASSRYPTASPSEVVQPVPFRGMAGYAFLVLGSAIWALSLSLVNPDGMNDLGLVSVLPPGIFIGVAILTVGFVLNLRSARWSERRLLLHVLALMVMLYGITALVFEIPRFATTWKLSGVTDFIQDYGTVLPRVDAFMNWPGFFILSAALTESMGLETPLQVAAWAHLGFNLLYLAPLYVLFTEMTDDKRHVWAAIWLFYSTNWVGQDYLAPQALGFLFFLACIAVCVRWFRVAVPATLAQAAGWRARLRVLYERSVAGWSGESLRLANPHTSPVQRMGLLAIILMMVIALIPSHQLTPFALAGTLLALMAVNRITLRFLPVIIVMLAVSWLAFGATAYLNGNLEDILAPMGRVADNVSRSVDRRVVGSPQHVIVVRMRVIMTLFFWGLAGLGILRRLRQGTIDGTMLVLALAPFVLTAVLAYGGELLLRVYLFTLPSMAFFTAAIVFASPVTAPLTRRASSVGLALALLLLAGFQVTRYGNERADYFTVPEVEAVEALYEQADGRSLLLAVTHDIPWRYAEYADHHYAVVSSYVRRDDVEGLIERMSLPQFDETFLIVTTRQYAGAKLFLDMDPARLTDFLVELEQSGMVEVTYRNPDAVIYRLKDNVRQPEDGAPPP